MKQEMVSVVIPSYNREKLITRSIASVLNQTWQAFEIIVVDDASTDDTARVVAGINDSRIRYIRLEENKGAGGARNVGVDAAKYDYIAFQDSDDEWLPTKLEKQMEKMFEQGADYGMVYCRFGGKKRGSEERFIFPPYQNFPKEVLSGEMLQRLLRQNMIGTPVMLLKKACFDAVGGFDERMRCLEDYEFALRFAARYRIGFVDECLLEVHKEENSVGTKVGPWLLTRCFILGRWQDEMRRMGIFESVEKNILADAEEYDFLEPTKELLRRVLGE